MEHKAGYVNIIGNPNVGKSTLMNALVGERLSIITSKARKIDFKNTIIIMTSNIGSRQLKDFGQGVGFSTALDFLAFFAWYCNCCIFKSISIST